jgi:hypothetical protein
MAFAGSRSAVSMHRGCIIKALRAEHGGQVEAGRARHVPVKKHEVERFAPLKRCDDCLVGDDGDVLHAERIEASGQEPTEEEMIVGNQYTHGRKVEQLREGKQRLESR